MRRAPARPANPEDRRRVRGAVATWAALALGGLAILAALALWHLIRRGRLIRERLGPVRDVDWPDLKPPSDQPIP